MESTLQTQLDFSQQLSSAIESVVTRFDKLVVDTQTQSDHIVNLVQEIEKSKKRMNELLLKSENLVQQVTASLEQNYVKNIQRFSEKSREAFALNISQMKYNFKLMMNLVAMSNKDFDKLIKSTNLSAKQIKSLGKIRKSLNKNKDALDDLQSDADSTKSTLERYETVAEKANMVKNTVLTGGASLLIDIPKIIFGFISAAINSIASLTGAMVKFYGFVQTIPFTIAKIASSIGNSIRQELVEVIHAGGEEAKEVFDLSSRIGKSAANLRDRSKELLKEMQNPRTRLAQLLGTGASGIAAFEKESFSLADSMGHYAEVFGPFILDNIENAKYLIEVQRAIGVGAQEMSYYAIEMYNSGKNPVDFMHELSSTIKNAADMNDVDMKQIAPSIHKLKTSIIDFGHMTTNEISNLVVKLRKMRVSTEDAVSVFKKFTSLEEASKASAMLFQSFNMNIDAFDLLTSRDPGEMLTQFRNAMRSTGKSFESLSRHEKALLQSITGISDQGLSSMMSMMDANMSYEEARKKMDQHDPVKQKTKMIKGLTTAIKQFQKIVQFESPFSAFFQGLMENVLSQQNLQGQLINFNKVYESIYQLAFNITPEEIQGITRPLVAVLTKIRNIFTGGGIEKLMTSVAKVTSGFVSDISVDLLSKKESKHFLTFRLKVQETIKLLKNKQAEALKVSLLNEASSNLLLLKPFLDSKEASSSLKRLFEKDKNGVYTFAKGITIDTLLETLTNAAENLPENSQYKKTLQNFRFRLSKIYKKKVSKIKLNQASKAVSNRLSVKGRIDNLYENLLGLFSEGQPLFIEFKNLSGRIMGAIIEGALSGMIALLELFNGGVDKSVVALNIASEKEIKKQFPNIKDPKKATLLDLLGITRSNYDELGNELSQESKRFVKNLPTLMSIGGKLMGDLLELFNVFALSVIGIIGGFTLAYYDNADDVTKGAMLFSGFSPAAAGLAKSKGLNNMLAEDDSHTTFQKLISTYTYTDKKTKEKKLSRGVLGGLVGLINKYKQSLHKESSGFRFLEHPSVSGQVNYLLNDDNFLNRTLSPATNNLMDDFDYNARARGLMHIIYSAKIANSILPSEAIKTISNSGNFLEEYFMKKLLFRRSIKHAYQDDKLAEIVNTIPMNTATNQPYSDSDLTQKEYQNMMNNIHYADGMEDYTLNLYKKIAADFAKDIPNTLYYKEIEKKGNINRIKSGNENLLHDLSYKYFRKYQLPDVIQNLVTYNADNFSASDFFAKDFYAKEKGMKVLIGDKVISLHDEDAIIAFKPGGYFESLFSNKQKEYFNVVNRLSLQNSEIIVENQKLKRVVEESIINKEEEASQEDIIKLVDLFLEVNSLIENREIIVEQPKLIFN